MRSSRRKRDGSFAPERLGMTKTTLAIACAVVMTSLACGEDGDSSSPQLRKTEETEQGLSTSFQNTCARCHGEEGKGKDTYPPIPGTRDEAAFITIVRSGLGEMPASDASQFSDADLKADYLWLTTKRR
jgi:mono/diheme cytochrome c family protein